MSTPQPPFLDGRGRDSALARTLRTGVGLQATVVVASVISLPFVTRVLSPAEYGVLVTLTAVIPLLGFADLGIGAAVTQLISKAVSSADEGRPREVVGAAVVVMACATLTLTAIGTGLSLVLPWQQVFGTRQISAASLTVSTLITSIAVAAFLFGGLGQAMLFGLQRGSAANRWLMVSSVAAAAASIGCAMLSAPLWAFVTAAVGVPALVGMICTVWVIMSVRSPVLRPRRGQVSARGLMAFGGTSKWFFLIGVSAAVGFQTDVLVVASVLGASSAGVLSVSQRLFGLISACLYPVLLQTWPAFAEASTTGDRAWIRSRFRAAVILAALVAGAASIGLVVFGNDIIRVVLTNELEAPRSLLVVLALWTVYSLSTAPMFFLMNALGRVRTHALFAASVAAVNFPLSILLAHRIGVAGPALATLLASVLLQGAPGILVVRGMFKELRADEPIMGGAGLA